MLKKSLIALAIASVAGSAFAAEFKEDQKNYLSIQGAQSSEYVKVNQAAAEEERGDLVLTLDAEYAQTDLLTFEFAGAHLIKPEDIVVRAKLLSKDEFGDAGSEKKVETGTMVLGVQPSSTENTLVLRVTSVQYASNGWTAGGEPAEDGTFPVPTAQQTTRDAQLTLENVKLDVPAILENGSASVTFSSKQVDGTALESIAKPYVLFEAKSQFELVAEKAPVDLINLAEDRFEFVTNTDTGADRKRSGQIELKVENDTDNMALPAGDPTDVQFTLPGQFGFMGEANAQGVVTLGDGAVIAPELVTDVVVLSTDKFVIGTADLTSGDIQFTAPNKTIIPHQVFNNASVTFKYDDAEDNAQTFSQAGVYAGEWNLNGTLIHVPFMPFRAGFSPIVNVSNVAQTDGVITVVAYDQHNDWAQPETYTLDLKAKAQAQTNITPALRELGLSGDLALDILVDLPKDNIAVNALFFREGDRAVIQTIDRSWVEKD